MESIKEKFLLYKIQAKQDADAFAELYDKYIGEIYRFIFFKVSHREEAQDLTSEVFLKTWNYLANHPHDKEIKSFRGLIYRIARNAVVDFYRARAQRHECALDEVVQYRAEDISSYTHIELKAEAARILQALKKMKREYQDIILLKYVEEMSVGEIAESLDKSQTAVRVTLHRATKVLKRMLGDSHEVGTYENGSPTIKTAELD